MDSLDLEQMFENWIVSFWIVSRKIKSMKEWARKNHRNVLSIQACLELSRPKENSERMLNQVGSSIQPQIWANVELFWVLFHHISMLLFSNQLTQPCLPTLAQFHALFLTNFSNPSQSHEDYLYISWQILPHIKKTYIPDTNSSTKVHPHHHWSSTIEMYWCGY